MDTSFSQRYRNMGVWALALCLLVIILETSAEGRAMTGSRPLSKRSFVNIQCRGQYDRDIFSKLDRVCDDCFNLYREPEVHILCRSNCFGSTYFKGCLDALLLSEEEEKYDEMIEVLGKK